MKLALLLFVFVLIGSFNSIQGGRKYYATPSPDTGCWGGYVGILEPCDPNLPDGMGRRGYGPASGSECNRICVHDHFHSSGNCGPRNHCCCRPKKPNTETDSDR